MNTSSTPIIPVYRALTIAGNVLERDEFGEVHHAVVIDTTSYLPAEIIYIVVGAGAKKLPKS
ncbi:MAG: hypothetical protein M3R08_04780 [Bacteroidota bacterium]|nr:hypothetical protein [Bacteroidota bacterium]